MKSNVQSRDYQNYLNDLKGYYGGQEQHEENRPIGERVRRLREMQGIDAEKLADIAGIDKNYLFDIESLKVFPDLGTIIRLSKALKISTGFILDSETGYSYSIVRKDARKRIVRSVSGRKEMPHYEYVALSTGVTSKHMESFIVTLIDKDYAEQSTHEGEEFLYVLEGTMAIMLGQKEETLAAGDSIFYLSTIPHALKNLGNDPAVILAVVYTG